MQGAIFKGGGDYPANEFIVGSGKNALLCRYQSEKRKLSEVDQLSIEFSKQVDTFQSTPLVILKMLIQFLLRKKMPIRLLMQQLVLVVELVLLPVKILLQCYSYQQKSHNFHYFLRVRLRQLTES